MQPRLLLGLLLWLMLSVEAQAATITLGSNDSDFSRIQAAIDAADSGDRILVYSGNYYENVDVDVPIILSGVDTGTGRPIVDAGRNGNAISLIADGCILEGFVVRNSSNNCAGIKVYSNNNIIRANIASTNYDGIYLDHSSDNIVEDNSAKNNQRSGIRLYQSSNNTINANIVCDNDDGIILDRSINNSITVNDVSDNNRCIWLYRSSNNTILGNNPKDIWLSSHDKFSENNTHDGYEHDIDLEDNKNMCYMCYVSMSAILVSHPDNTTIDFGYIPFNYIIINSVPPGAQIWLDGNDTGKLSSTENCTIYFAWPGNHTCELHLDGYEILPINITIPESGSRTINVTLEKINNYEGA